MTIPVSLAELPATLEQFASAVLITPRDGTWAHILTVDPVLDGDSFVVALPQPRTPAAGVPLTLIWTPTVRHGFTLVVDGLATYTDGQARLAIDHAMLHRPEAHADGPDWPYASPGLPEAETRIEGC